MATRWKVGDDPLAKYWKYRRKHEKLSVGKPAKINASRVLAYAKNIELALNRLTKKQWIGLAAATTPGEIAKIIESLKCTDNPHERERDFAACRRCTLLGGWRNRLRNQWPTHVPPEGDMSAGLLLMRVGNRTTPELICEALADKTFPLARPRSKQVRYIAESIAAPALYDQVLMPLEWINAPTKVRRVESPHVGQVHECPACGAKWKCSIVGCSKDQKHSCSDCARNSGPPSNDVPAGESRQASTAPVYVPLPKPVIWRPSLRYSRDICARQRRISKKMKTGS